MKTLVLILLLIALTGCGILNGFVMPDDPEFLAVVESLDTPAKICEYMKENFEYEYHMLGTDPYTLWKTRKGDCSDLAKFAGFIANYHGYETYKINIYFKNALVGHALAVYKENGKYTYSSNKNYHPIGVDTFKEIVSDYIDKYGGELFYFKVVSNG